MSAIRKTSDDFEHPYFSRSHNQYYNSETGEKLDYDVCSESTLQEAKEFYGSRYDHVYYGFITYHNNTKSVWEKEHHFFILKKD